MRSDSNSSRREIIYALLRVALETEPDTAKYAGMLEDIAPEEWEGICLVAREQAITGIIYDALSRLDARLPQNLSIGLITDAEKIELYSRQIHSLSEKICLSMESMGFHPIIMKGSGVAAYYPSPFLKTPGDIDIYLPPEEFRDIGRWAERYLSEMPVTSPDGSLQAQAEGIHLDIHSRFYDLLSVSGKRLPPVPSPESTLVMLSSHILKHAMGTGVGLRQICDMAMAYRSLENSYDPDSLIRYYRESHILSWNRLLSSLIEARLHVRTPVCGGRDYSALERMIFEGGNFGHFAKSRQDAMRKGPAGRKRNTAMQMAARAPFALRIAPREYLSYIMQLVKGNNP